jgi:hypothetical protein
VGPREVLEVFGYEKILPGLDSNSIPPTRSLVPTRPTLTSLYSRSVTQANISHCRTRTLLTHNPKHLMFLDYTRVKISCNVLYLYVQEHTLFKQIKTNSTFPHFPAQLTLVGVSVRTSDMQTGTTGKRTGSLFRPRTTNGLRDNNHTI